MNFTPWSPNSGLKFQLLLKRKRKIRTPYQRPEGNFACSDLERHGQHKSSYARNPGISKRLKDFFGHVKISKINSGYIESYRLMRLSQKSRADRAVSNVTVNRDIEVLRAMFGKAVRWGFPSRHTLRCVVATSTRWRRYWGTATRRSRSIATRISRRNSFTLNEALWTRCTWEVARIDTKWTVSAKTRGLLIRKLLSKPVACSGTKRQLSGYANFPGVDPKSTGRPEGTRSP